MALFIIGLVLLVAIIGFWDALGVILGGVAIVIVLFLMVAAAAGWAGIHAFRKPRDPRL